MHVVCWWKAIVLICNCRRRDARMLCCQHSIQPLLFLSISLCLRLCHFGLHCHETHLLLKYYLHWVYRLLMILWMLTLTLVQILFAAAGNSGGHSDAVTDHVMMSPAVLMHILICMRLINGFLNCHSIRINSWWWKCMVSNNCNYFVWVRFT